ncbi:MAG: hypothetical protein H6909_00550 [Rickettsiaceae bacterium]|nr:hypothetical protein [Rickettsiaceae bacterium]
MSCYLPCIIGANPKIDNVLIKIIAIQGLKLEETSIRVLEVDESSGKENIGVFLISTIEENPHHWVIKIEDGEPDYEIKKFVDDINDFKLQYPQLLDILVLPITVVQEEALVVSVMDKAHGRSLYDIRTSYNPTLVRPSFYEFDSYDSYVAEIESRFEEPRTPMTTVEISDIYYRLGKALGKLHDIGINNNIHLVHSDLHENNIFISANSVQFIDNSMSVIGIHEPDNTSNISLVNDLEDIVEECFDIIFCDKDESLNIIRECVTSFFKGYINSFENKIACVEYLKTSFTQQSLWANIEIADTENFFSQLDSIIDSIANLEKFDDNCTIPELCGDILNQTEISE